MVKKITLTEMHLKNAIKETIIKSLQEGCPAIPLNFPEETEPIIEMARINMKESGKKKYISI